MEDIIVSWLSNVIEGGPMAWQPNIPDLRGEVHMSDCWKWSVSGLDFAYCRKKDGFFPHLHIDPYVYSLLSYTQSTQSDLAIIVRPSFVHHLRALLVSGASYIFNIIILLCLTFYTHKKKIITYNFCYTNLSQLKR